MIALWDWNTKTIIEEFTDCDALVEWLTEKYLIATNETRKVCGLESAFEFADDYGMTTEEYIRENGLPFEDDESWADMVMNNLRLGAGTRTGNNMLIHNVFAAARNKA